LFTIAAAPTFMFPANISSFCLILAIHLITYTANLNPLTIAWGEIYSHSFHPLSQQFYIGHLYILMVSEHGLCQESFGIQFLKSCLKGLFTATCSERSFLQVWPLSQYSLHESPSVLYDIRMLSAQVFCAFCTLLLVSCSRQLVTSIPSLHLFGFLVFRPIGSCPKT
jgi:hypothetical protein